MRRFRFDDPNESMHVADIHGIRAERRLNALAFDRPVL
jgi:hypothetical protein